RDLNGVDKKKGLGLHLPYLMNDVQAVMGRCQLKKLDGFISRRREFASQFNMALKSMFIELPSDMPFRKHIYFRYCLKLNQPIDPVLDFLQQNSIRAERPIFSPLHLLDHQKPINKRICFAGTEKAWMNTISLPIYPDLGKNEIEREICFLKKGLSI
ncbi:MAG: DegT/DnrJ/EryC1/StrS family aminotransferase, partial [bacterium]